MEIPNPHQIASKRRKARRSVTLLQCRVEHNEMPALVVFGRLRHRPNYTPQPSHAWAALEFEIHSAEESNTANLLFYQHVFFFISFSPCLKEHSCELRCCP